MIKKLLFPVFLLNVLWAQAQQPTIEFDPTTPQVFKPQISTGQYLGKITPLRDIQPDMQPLQQSKGKMYERKNYFGTNEAVNPDALPQHGDALRQKPNATENLLGTSLTPKLNIEGLSKLDGAYPPDPTGDIGLNHYVQAVNKFGGSYIKIWDKDGQVVAGPINSASIWQQVGTGSIGDPIIQYDHAAQRWLILELQGFFTNELLIAVSEDSDPTGAWSAYRFQTPNGFADYPKLTVWNDAYIVTANEIGNNNGGNLCSAYVLEREKLLHPDPLNPSNFQVLRYNMPKVPTITFQPPTSADWEGGDAPPAGSPGMILRMYDDTWGANYPDHLEIWEIYNKWDNPTTSQLVGPKNLFPTPFESKVCYGFQDCIEQPDPTAPRLTAMENTILYRVPYRNFGTHESLVLNHIADVSGEVGVGGDAGVRWYELRRYPGGEWTIYQEGTYAPDNDSRFMGTISIDATGNIGLGYSVVGANTYPGLRLTGRRASDPLGMMTVDEYSLIEGGKSHDSSRWGDYSSMAVDPVDGRTFWFTAEYQPADGNWGTRIGAFVLRRDTFDVRPKTLVAPQPSISLGTAETVTVEVFNEGLVAAENVSVALRFEGNLVATELMAEAIPPGESKLHTFIPKVNMSEPGKTYTFDLKTAYALDQYALNNDLQARVRKQTSADASPVGRANFNGIACSSEQTFGVIIKNASGLPMTHCDVVLQLNSNFPLNLQWTGDLAPGERDTMQVELSGFKSGSNVLTIVTANPNGMADEDIHNDTLFMKIVGNLNGAPMAVLATANIGQLNWQIRDKITNQLLYTGDARTGFALPQNICMIDGKCYKVVLKGLPTNWKGSFKLFDYFGKLIVERIAVTGEEVIEFCLPERALADVGPLQLSTPSSAPALTATETVKVQVRNFGKNAQTGTQIRYRLDNGAWQTEPVSGTLQPGETQPHTFAIPADLSEVGRIYAIETQTILAGDLVPQNDVLQTEVINRAPRDLAVTGLRIERACSDLDDINAIIQVRNTGTETIDSFQLAATLNGVPTDPVFLKVPIGAGGSFEYGYAIAAPSVGTYTYAVDVVDVNGQGEDFTQRNDTASAPFTLQTGGFPIYAFFILDAKPQETRWQILDDQNNVVLSGGPYAIDQSVDMPTFCLIPEKCYTFRLLDSGNDGMTGQIILVTSTGVLWELTGYDFGSMLDHPFCTTGPCGFFTATAMSSPASSVTTANGTATIHVSGGTPPYLFSRDNFQFVEDSTFTGLLPGVYTFYVSDANLCEYSVTVEVKVVSAAGEVSANRTMLLAPNPTAGLIQVSIPALAGEQEAWAEVFDASGNLLFVSHLVRWDDTLRSQFSVEKYPAGSYFVRVKGLDRVFAGRVVRL